MPPQEDDLKLPRWAIDGPNEFEWIRSSAQTLSYHLRDVDEARKAIDSIKNATKRKRAIVLVRTTVRDLRKVSYELERTINELSRHYGLR